MPPVRTNPVKNREATELEVDAWNISSFVIKRLVPVVGVHPFPLHELMLMTAAVCWIRPTQIYEWGTHIGKSARVFYEITNHYRIDCTIHSTDLPDTIDHVEHPHAERGRLVRGLPRVVLHQGDGLDVSLALWRSSGSNDSQLFFLDGDHSVTSVRRELGAIVGEVAGANILLHDTFYQSDASGYNIGPHQAIEELIRAQPGRFHATHSGLGLPGMTLLRPSAQTSDARANRPDEVPHSM